MISTVIFDADDTLWHNESLFTLSHQKFGEMLAPFHEPSWIDERLYATEVHNLALFGYGIKGFTLSMIETAIELSEGRIGGADIQRIIDLGKDMLRAPTEPLPHVRETLERLHGRFKLMVITKGDLFDQEAKVARSRLGDFFNHVEVVSEKNVAIYGAVFERLGLVPRETVMVGNSLKSDILPVLEHGVTGVHIPYHTTWIHERVDPSLIEGKTYHTLEHIGLLPDLLSLLTARTE